MSLNKIISDKPTWKTIYIYSLWVIYEVELFLPIIEGFKISKKETLVLSFLVGIASLFAVFLLFIIGIYLYYEIGQMIPINYIITNLPMIIIVLSSITIFGNIVLRILLRIDPDFFFTILDRGIDDSDEGEYSEVR